MREPCRIVDVFNQFALIRHIDPELAIYQGDNMHKLAVPILLSAVFSLPAISMAASPMKPGLWEVATESDMFKEMPKITPQQAAQMRQMGIEVPQAMGGAVSMKMCFTKEMTESDEPPVHERSDGCQTKNMRMSGNSYSAEMVCNNAEMKGHGTIQAAYHPTRFDSTVTFKGVMHGKPVNTNTKTSGRWLGANCGNIRPVR